MYLYKTATQTLPLCNRTIVHLLFKCIVAEQTAVTPAKRQYWHNQWKRLNALAKRVGWID